MTSEKTVRKEKQVMNMTLKGDLVMSDREIKDDCMVICSFGGIRDKR